MSNIITVENMTMPSSCDECRFCDNNPYNLWCLAVQPNRHIERENLHERQSFCPLKEWITEIRWITEDEYWGTEDECKVRRCYHIDIVDWTED